MPNAGNIARRRYVRQPEQYLRNQNVGNARQNRQITAPPLSRPLQFCTSKFLKRTIITMVVTTVLLIFYQAYYANYKFLDLSLNFYEYSDKDENVQTAAKILRKCVNDYNNLLLLETQLSSFVEGESLATLLKQKLQPFQDELTSLTSQTNKYENMKASSPGGGAPEQFISSTLARLDDMDDKFIVAVEDDPEIKRVRNEDAALANQMASGIRTLLEQASFTDAVMYDEKLESEGIYIVTRHDVDAIDGGKYIDNLLLKHKPAEIVQLYEELIAKLEKRDEFLEKATLLEEQEAKGIKADSITENNIYASLDYYDEILINWIQERDILIQLFYPHHSITINKVVDLQEKLLAYAGAGQKRQGYLKLKERLQEDISKLRLRIKNLRYDYAKKSS